MNLSTPLVALAAILLAVARASFPFRSSDSSPEFPSEALPTSSGYLKLNRSSPREAAAQSQVKKMFYAFYEAQEPARSIQETPLLIWLQGGPGCSSMTGNFYELGPWKITPDLELERNPHSWNKRFALLFIDSPVGTGYSISESDGDVPVDQTQVARDLFSALQLFFDSQKPFFRKRPFFIAGESYAGKYVPALGHYIMDHQRKSPVNVGSGQKRMATGLSPTLRLDGLIIGNGLTHPVTQVQTHAQAAYNFGLIDKQQRSQAEALASTVVELINKEDWPGAYTSRLNLLSWYENVTGLATFLDVRRAAPYHFLENGTEFLGLFLNRGSVKAALKADPSSEWFSCNSRVRRIMSGDTTKSVKWMVEDLLAELPVLLYQGQFDIMDGVVSSEEWIEELEWEGREEFEGSPRSIWRVGGRVAGYWRAGNRLTHVAVVGAGHMVPADQGLHSQEMIEKWIDQQL